MKPKDNDSYTAKWEKPASSRQIHLMVNGSKVKMNVPSKPESTVISDVKRMMLGGVVKT
jgi:hypothetical protein